MTTPLFMRDVSLTLKVLPSGPSRVQFNCDVKLAAIETTPGDIVKYLTLCASGGQFQSVGKSSWLLHIVAAQDWSATGLANFLWVNDGAQAEFQYQAYGTAAMPPTASQPGMAGVVQLVAANYGDEVNKYAEFDVKLPCATKPTMTVAVFPTMALDAAGNAIEVDPETGEPLEAEELAEPVAS